jgi:hypothetical protein
MAMSGYLRSRLRSLTPYDHVSANTVEMAGLPMDAVVTAGPAHSYPSH